MTEQEPIQTKNTEWPVCPWCGDVKDIYPRLKKGAVRITRKKRGYKSMMCLCERPPKNFSLSTGPGGYTTGKLNEPEE